MVSNPVPSPLAGAGQIETTALRSKDASRAIWGLVYLTAIAVVLVLGYLLYQAVSNHSALAGDYLGKLALSLGLGGGGTGLLFARSPLQR